MARGARLAVAALVAAAAWPGVGAAQTFTHTVFEIAVDNKKVNEHPAVRFENDPRPVKVGMEIPRGLALRIDTPGVVVRIRNTDDRGPAGAFERISLDCNPRSCPAIFNPAPRDQNDARYLRGGRIVVYARNLIDRWVAALWFPSAEQQVNMSIEGTTFELDTSAYVENRRVYALSVTEGATMMQVIGASNPVVRTEANNRSLVDGAGKLLGYEPITRETRLRIAAALEPFRIARRREVSVIVERGDDSEARGLRLKSENELTDATSAFRSSLSFWERVLREAEDEGQRTIVAKNVSRVLTHLGEVSQDLNLPATALEYFERALKTAEGASDDKPDSTYLVARARLGVGDCLWRLKKGSGQSEIGRAVSELESLEDAGLPSTMRTSYESTLARALTSQSRGHRASTSLLKRALALQEAQPIARAWLLLLLGQPGAARSLLREQLDLDHRDSLSAADRMRANAFLAHAELLDDAGSFSRYRSSDALRAYEEGSSSRNFKERVLADLDEFEARGFFRYDVRGEWLRELRDTVRYGRLRRVIVPPPASRVP